MMFDSDHYYPPGHAEKLAEQQAHRERTDSCGSQKAIGGLFAGNRAAAEGCQIEPTPTDDPWKHRSSGMQCRTCMWFVEKAVPPVTKLGYQRIGRCRRHAPSMNGYPVVYPADWCGDHKLDETKL